MRKIKLGSRFGIYKHALVDDDNYDWLNQWRWYCHNRGYAVRAVGIGNGRQKAIFMHRLVINTPKRSWTDHIDNNKLNNQKENLRIVTHSQNGMNRKNTKHSTSIFKGVSWDKKRDKWKVGITKNSKRCGLGYFKREEDAGKAYDRKAIELFGEFARLNFPKLEEK